MTTTTWWNYLYRTTWIPIQITKRRDCYANYCTSYYPNWVKKNLIRKTYLHNNLLQWCVCDSIKNHNCWTNMEKTIEMKRKFAKTNLSIFFLPKEPLFAGTPLTHKHLYGIHWLLAYYYYATRISVYWAKTTVASYTLYLSVDQSNETHYEIYIYLQLRVEFDGKTNENWLIYYNARRFYSVWYLCVKKKLNHWHLSFASRKRGYIRWCDACARLQEGLLASSIRSACFCHGKRHSVESSG